MNELNLYFGKTQCVNLFFLLGADVTAEIAVYADKNYANFLKSSGRNTLAKATKFFANKWNTVRHQNHTGQSYKVFC